MGFLVRTRKCYDVFHFFVYIHVLLLSLDRLRNRPLQIAQFYLSMSIWLAILQAPEAERNSPPRVPQPC